MGRVLPFAARSKGGSDSSGPVDELAVLPPLLARSLIRRGLVFKTHRYIDREMVVGHIVASDLSQAYRIAMERGWGEIVLGPVTAPV